MAFVMARMEKFLPLPFLFFISFALQAQEVKKLEAGFDMHDTSFVNRPTADTSALPSKQDSISKIIQANVKPNTIDSVKKTAELSTVAGKAFLYKVPSYFSVGISANSYSGDLSPAYRIFSPSLHLGIQLNKKRWLNGYLGVSLGQITGQTDNSPYSSPSDPNIQSNTYFNTIFFTAHYELHFNFIKKEHFIFYASGGIGFMNFTPYDLEGKNLSSQAPTRAKNESYTNNSAIFPVGIGAIATLKNHWGLSIQTGFLNPTTGYLDNIQNLSTYKGGDNVFYLKLALLAPLKVNK